MNTDGGSGVGVGGAVGVAGASGVAAGAEITTAVFGAGCAAGGWKCRHTRYPEYPAPPSTRSATSAPRTVFALSILHTILTTLSSPAAQLAGRAVVNATLVLAARVVS